MSYTPQNPNGQATSANSSPVVLSSDAGDVIITGQSGLTAVVNNILPQGATSTTGTDCQGFRSAAVQIISTGTTGGYVFEGSNDNTNWATVTVQNTASGGLSNTITPSATIQMFVIPLTFRYLRCRISTVIGSGSVQAITRLSQQSISNIGGVYVSTGSLTSVSSVTTVTNGNLGLPAQITDVASAAITSTTVSATLTPTFGSAYQVAIPVTVVGGTTPTLDVTVQESLDGGTNWLSVYQFPRITATGNYVSPPLTAMGNRIRYSYVTSGTTPSFTTAIIRIQSSSPGKAVRQLIDRSVTLTTLSSTTASLNTEASGSNLQLVINVGAITTTAPALQLQGSDDTGATWYSLGSPLTSVASTTVQSTITNVNAQFVRAIVTTAGVGVTSGYVLVKTF